MADSAALSRSLAKDLCAEPWLSLDRAEIPRLRGERDEALRQAARLESSRDDLARQQGQWKGKLAKVPEPSNAVPCKPYNACLIYAVSTVRSEYERQMPMKGDTRLLT